MTQLLLLLALFTVSLCDQKYSDELDIGVSILRSSNQKPALFYYSSTIVQIFRADILPKDSVCELLNLSTQDVIPWDFNPSKPYCPVIDAKNHTKETMKTLSQLIVEKQQNVPYFVLLIDEISRNNLTIEDIISFQKAIIFIKTQKFYRDLLFSTGRWNYFGLWLETTAFDPTENSSLHSLKSWMATMLIGLATVLILVLSLIIVLNYPKPISDTMQSTKKTVIWIYLIAMVLLTAGMLLLFFFLYDYLIYISIFGFVLLASSSSCQAFSRLIGLCFPKLRDPAATDFCIRKRTVKFCGSFRAHESIIFLIFLSIAITWACLIRIQPISWSLHYVLSIFTLIGVHSNWTYGLSFRLTTYIFVLLTAYDVFMVYLTPYFQIQDRSFTVFAQTSVMESVAMGYAGNSGLLVPYAFRIMMDPYDPTCNRLLGFGDVIIPNLMMITVALYDKTAKKRTRPMLWLGSLFGFILGLSLAFIVAYSTGKGQPALIFLCPSVFLSIILTVLLLDGPSGVKHLWYYKFPAQAASARDPEGAQNLMNESKEENPQKCKSPDSPTT